jgi:hypothetical protein
MPLTNAQIKLLDAAIKCYSFPSAYTHFSTTPPTPVSGLSITNVETLIGNGLKSKNTNDVEIALANILYWGYSQQPGRQKMRPMNFRSGVTQQQLAAATMLFSNGTPSLVDIRRLGMPEFSGTSFVSKVRMFLDPVNSATLDFQILKMRGLRPTVLDKITLHKGGTQIPINKNNSIEYENWNKRLQFISKKYFSNKYRVVDIERGFFQLINKCSNVVQAADILSKA